MTPEFYKGFVDRVTSQTMYGGMRELEKLIREAVAEEREKHTWRDVKIDQPEWDAVVLVTANQQAATITYKGEFWHWTHWQPFVEPETT